MTATGSGGLPTPRRYWVGGLALLLAAMTLLASTVQLGFVVLAHTKDLQASTKFTQDIVNANVRTLSQVQRELLRMKVLVASGVDDRTQLDLQRQLVSERMQEATLSYQRATLGTAGLLEQAQGYVTQWRTTTEPLLQRIEARSGDADVALRSEADAQLTALEKGFNQLVSDGEINRRLRAGDANAATVALLDNARRLLRLLLLTMVGFVLFVAVALFTYYRFDRNRARVARELVELNAEMRTLSAVASSTDNLVLTTDAEGRVEWVNAAFTRVTGYALDDVSGRRADALLDGPATDAGTVALMRAHMARGEAFTGELLGYCKDGSTLWVSVEVQPVRNDAGGLAHHIAVLTDVTERRGSEEHLRRAKEAAEETAQEKANFLAAMSHEIRTPLNAMLGLTGLLLDTELTTQQRDYLETARSSGNLLLSVINDILSFSALESGRVEDEQTTFTLAGLVDSCVSILATEAERKGLALEATVDLDLPPVVRGEETRLRQVLVNLLANAVKFTGAGTVTVAARRVRVAGEPDGQVTVALSVRDTGIGIPAERLDRLFQPFSQVDASTTRQYGGTGLGLALCRLIADRLGGRIGVETAPGVGSTFTFVVPLAVGDVADLGGAAVPTADDPAAGLAPGLRILLAEDDKVNQTVALHMLKRLGYRADVAGDGVEALEAVARIPYDIVLMDVHMPRMDGLEATRRIRETLPADEQPVVITITANAMAGDRERLLAGGMDGYLSKPFDLAQLADVLRRVGRRGQSVVSVSMPAGRSRA